MEADLAFETEGTDGSVLAGRAAEVDPPELVTIFDVDPVGDSAVIFAVDDWEYERSAAEDVCKLLDF